MDTPRIFISGLGHVGRAMLTLLKEASSPACRVAGLADSSGALISAEGFTHEELDRVAAAKATGRRLSALEGGLGGGFRADPLPAIAESRPDLLVELSPTDLSGGGAAGGYARAGLAAGADLIFASKGVLASDWHGITEAVRRAGRRMRFSATVGGGMPVLDAGLAFAQANPIDSIEALLNGTCVYIVSLMETGMEFDDALKAAQAAGMAEADPAADVDGWDAAAKLSILSRVAMGCPLDVNAIERGSLRKASGQAVRSALRAGKRLRAVGRIERVPAAAGPDGARASIRLVEVDARSALARSGSENAVVFSSRYAGDLALIGKGAGPRETAAAVLRDLAILSAGNTPYS
jgi:homoserine dehydrogenase